MEYWTLTVIRDSFLKEKIKYELEKFVPYGNGKNTICYRDIGFDRFIFYKSEKKQLLDFIKNNNIKVARIDKKNVDMNLKKEFVY